MFSVVCGSARLDRRRDLLHLAELPRFFARKQRILRERVTYLLWVAAQGVTR